MRISEEIAQLPLLEGFEDLFRKDGPPPLCISSKKINKYWAAHPVENIKQRQPVRAGSASAKSQCIPHFSSCRYMPVTAAFHFFMSTSSCQGAAPQSVFVLCSQLANDIPFTSRVTRTPHPSRSRLELLIRVRVNWGQSPERLVSWQGLSVAAL